jgi:hypothetical protein
MDLNPQTYDHLILQLTIISCSTIYVTAAASQLADLDIIAEHRKAFLFKGEIKCNNRGPFSRTIFMADRKFEKLMINLLFKVLWH